MIFKFLRGGEVRVVGRDLTNFSALYKKRPHEENIFNRDNVIRVLLAGVRGPGKQGNGIATRWRRMRQTTWMQAGQKPAV